MPDDINTDKISDDDFPKIRRNLILWSIVLVLFSFGKLEITKSTILGLQLHMTGREIAWTALFIHIYILVRYIQNIPDSIAIKDREQMEDKCFSLKHKYIEKNALASYRQVNNIKKLSKSDIAIEFHDGGPISGSLNLRPIDFHVVSLDQTGRYPNYEGSTSLSVLQIKIIQIRSFISLAMVNPHFLEYHFPWILGLSSFIISMIGLALAIYRGALP